MTVPDASTRPSGRRLLSTLVGAALGTCIALVAAAVSCAHHHGTEDSVWTFARLSDAYDIALIVGLAAAVLSLLMVVAAAAPRRSEARWGRRLAGGVGGVAIGGLLVAFMSDVYTSPWVALVAALMLLVTMVWTLRWTKIEPRPALVVATTLVVGVIGSVLVVAAPLRQPVPKADLIDWWAAHENPPIGFLGEISDVGVALDENPRDAAAVTDACEAMRQSFADLTGPPAAPRELTNAVATLAEDLDAVAEQCIERADSITKAELEALLNAATSSPAAKSIDETLHLDDVNL